MYSDERTKDRQHDRARGARHGRRSVARLFDVTEDCIRKDLRRLVAQGRCRKVYGGATRAEAEINRNIAERVDTLRPRSSASPRRHAS